MRVRGVLYGIGLGSWVLQNSSGRPISARSLGTVRGWDSRTNALGAPGRRFRFRHDVTGSCILVALCRRSRVEASEKRARTAKTYSLTS